MKTKTTRLVAHDTIAGVAASHNVHLLSSCYAKVCLVYFWCGILSTH